MLAFGGYALLLPVVPVHAAAGGASPAAAGATTGVFMATTVAAQLTVPALLRRLGPRAALVAGTLALGVPALPLAVTSGLPVLFAVAVVRGVGFGLLTVTGAALIADLAPPSKRGRAVGLYGVAVGLPQLVLLSGGVWAYDAFGSVVMVAGGVLPVAAACCCARLPTARAAPRDRSGTLPASAAAPPWTAMVVSAAAAGGVITVLPLWAASGLVNGTTTAAVALAVLTAGQLAGRGVGGELADRPGTRLRTPALTLAGLAIVALGAAVVAVGGTSSGVAVLAGAALVGLGFGAVQSDTLLALFARAGPTRSGTASTWWNTGYDAGTGLGAAALSAVLGAAGGSAAFVVAAIAGVVAMPLALRGRRAARSPARPDSERPDSERRAPSVD